MQWRWNFHAYTKSLPLIRVAPLSALIKKSVDLVFSVSSRLSEQDMRGIRDSKFCVTFQRLPTKQHVIEFDVGCKLTSCHKTTASSSGNCVEFNWQLFFALNLLDYRQFLFIENDLLPEDTRKILSCK